MSTTGTDYLYENHAYIRSTSVQAEAIEKAVWTCKRAEYPFDVRDRVRASFSKKEDNTLIFSCYIVSQAQIESEQKAQHDAEMKQIKEDYKNFYLAKEKLYEIYKRDGKLHTDTYADPDGTIHSTSIHGESRCDSVSGSTGSTLTCN